MGIAIELAGVSKSYPVYRSPAGRLKELATGGRVRAHDDFWALRDVTLEVSKGEAFGLIGRNGSGKSTLLQIVSGILAPSSGDVKVHGRLSALLELGSGFNPEFTGRENVYLNASILGLSRDEIDARYEAICGFADIGSFIGQPVKTYSTGMVMRLAFSVAIHVDPEILIVDEALAVGDIAFRQRCMKRVHDLRAEGVTILFVSHEAGDVKALCERCAWLDNGELRAIGGADDVIAQYLAEIARAEGGGTPARVERTEPVIAPEVVRTLAGSRHRYGDGRATLLGTVVSCSGSRALLRMSFRINAAMEKPIAGFIVRDSKGVNLFGTNTTREGRPLAGAIGGDIQTVDFHWTMPELAGGVYPVSVAVSDGTLDEFTVCDYAEDTAELRVEASRPVTGYLRLPSRVRILDGEPQP